MVDQLQLTIRRPDEILAMEFNDDDLFVDNGILAKGQPLTILGPGGIGKSRFLLQLLICILTGESFLGWKVAQRQFKILLLQAENANRRLYADLKRLCAWVGAERWKHVESSLSIHTLEQDHDSFLSLDNHASASRLAAVTKNAKADVVVFDPLYAFAAGNLNTDTGMLKTCKALNEVAKVGNPDATVVILHHTLTGKPGRAKATGFDRTSYGRGSKALQFWTRGQINLAPASPDSNDELIIACGKNSNFPEFQPFGVRLDAETLIFEVDPEFDLENWKTGVTAGTGTKPAKVTPADLVRDLPLTKKELCAQIMEEVGCGRANAYRLINEADGKTIRRNSTKRYEAIPAEDAG